MKGLIAAVAFAATLASISAALAQLYPARPITVVVPFAAGGPTDVIARTLAQPMRASLGQSVIIENVAEAGLPGFYFSRWHALWAPKGTPKDVIAKLNAAVVGALADPLVRSRLADLGQEIFPRDQQTPEALGAYHKAEIEKWWPIIKAAGITAE